MQSGVSTTPQAHLNDVESALRSFSFSFSKYTIALLDLRTNHQLFHSFSAQISLNLYKTGLLWWKSTLGIYVQTLVLFQGKLAV